MSMFLLEQMKLSGFSSGLVAARRSSPIHALRTADASFNFYKLANQPRRLGLKYPIQMTRLLGENKGNHKQSTIVCALSNEDDECEKSSSHAWFDDQMIFPFEVVKRTQDPDMEDVSSGSLSQEEFSEISDYIARKGSIIDKLMAVQLCVLALERWNSSLLKLCHRNYMVSATNLIHYLALKCLNVEQLTEDLILNGLMNLETINPHVLASLTSGIQLLEKLNPDSLTSTGIDELKYWEFAIDKTKKKESLNRELLLGTLYDGRTAHIMVTVGEEATKSETLITDLLNAGTTIFRINCAHGNPSIWSKIIERMKTTSHMLEKPCRILMDLAGPKLRTGKLKQGPCVIKISPKKDATGNVIKPAQVWLSHKETGPPPHHVSPDAILYVNDPEALSKLKSGDAIKFHDCRGKQRMLKICEKFHIFSGTGLVAKCSKTAYVQSGTDLYVMEKKGKWSVGQIVDIPPSEPFVRLQVGDLLFISRDSSGNLEEPVRMKKGAHRITCPSGVLFDSVKPGERIAFDDGKIWGVIQSSDISEIAVSITHAGPKGTKLKSEKSINIPESDVKFEGFTSKDLMDLKFVAAHADMVGMSFIRDVRDIVVLHGELEKQKLGNLGIILKIETEGGYRKLPLILLQAMRSPNPLGVMIARGDLAVECGWERFADIQEEILSVCRAAHVPVIWATQVLESLVKSGVPTKPELTDVASGMRADCIMLNKGRNIVEAVSFINTMLHNSAVKKKKAREPIILSSHLF